MIIDGGDQPNVVPSEAAVWYYFRELEYPRIKELYELGNKMAQAATMMTETTVTQRVVGPAWPCHFNKDKMEKFRHELKKYYYDPAKYKTYLEQLGIQYPTVKK